MGQMSAWYVLSAMGFYPVNPVSGQYEIGSPLFNQVKISLPEGKAFILTAKNLSDENIYVKSVTIDGKPWNKSYITHQQIIDGANVELEMTSEEGNVWYDIE